MTSFVSVILRQRKSHLKSNRTLSNLHYSSSQVYSLVDASNCPAAGKSIDSFHDYTFFYKKLVYKKLVLRWPKF